MAGDGRRGVPGGEVPLPAGRTACLQPATDCPADKGSVPCVTSTGSPAQSVNMNLRTQFLQGRTKRARMPFRFLRLRARGLALGTSDSSWSTLYIDHVSSTFHLWDPRCFSLFFFWLENPAISDVRHLIGSRSCTHALSLSFFWLENPAYPLRKMFILK